jgi:hypothetical protein
MANYWVFVGANWGGVWGIGGANNLGMHFREMGFNSLQVTTLLGMCFVGSGKKLWSYKF